MHHKDMRTLTHSALTHRAPYLQSAEQTGPKVWEEAEMEEAAGSRRRDWGRYRDCWMGWRAGDWRPWRPV